MEGNREEGFRRGVIAKEERIGAYQVISMPRDALGIATTTQRTQRRIITRGCARRRMAAQHASTQRTRMSGAWMHHGIYPSLPLLLFSPHALIHFLSFPFVIFSSSQPLVSPCLLDQVCLDFSHLNSPCYLPLFFPSPSVR